MSELRFLLDTNVVIGILAGSIAAREMLDRNDARPDNCAVSQITRIELLSFHALTPDDEQKIAALIATLDVILLDERIEQSAIAMRRRNRLRLPDVLIAATAEVHGLVLLTLDGQLASAVGAPGAAP